MVKKRNRRKQTTTLETRLSKFRRELQIKAKELDPDCDEARQLLRRIQSTDAALELNASLVDRE